MPCRCPANCFFLQLKRYSQSRGALCKETCIVPLEAEALVEVRVFASRTQGTYRHYPIISAVYHFGNALDSGHFRAALSAGDILMETVILDCQMMGFPAPEPLLVTYRRCTLYHPLLLGECMQRKVSSNMIENWQSLIILKFGPFVDLSHKACLQMRVSFLVCTVVLL